MKRMILTMVTFIFLLTGCAGAETDEENGATLTETIKTTVSADDPQTQNVEPESGTLKNITETDDTQRSAEQGGEGMSMLPVFYLDFGEISPETVSAIRWPATYIGDAQSHSKDFEKVTVEFERDMITLVPLGDGDYVYEITAAWGEVGHASYTFRTLPQIREEQKDELTGIFDALNKLEYKPYTCDGLPEYRLTAADGTVYDINFSEKWVWRGKNEQAELSDELLTQLKETMKLDISDK